MKPGIIIKYVLFCAGIVFSALAAGADRKVPVTEPSSPEQIEKRLENIEHMLQNQGLLDMLQQIQKLQKDVTDMRGQLEVYNHELENLKEKQRKLYNDVDSRLQQLSKQEQGTSIAESAESTETETPPLQIITPSEDVTPAGDKADSSLTVENVPDEQVTVKETQPGSENTATETETGASDESSLATVTEEEPAGENNPVEIQAHYQDAFRLLKQADYDQAITAFDKFLSKYPDSQYSDNAQYWMGEAYYVTRRFDAAITEYMKLISNYPQSQRVPNSLLKIGYSYFELGKPDEAKKVLQELIDKYPGTSAAADAQEHLEKLSTAS